MSDKQAGEMELPQTTIDKINSKPYPLGHYAVSYTHLTLPTTPYV